MKKGLILGVSAFLLVCGLTGCVLLEEERKKQEWLEQERKEAELGNHWDIYSKLSSFIMVNRKDAFSDMVNWENAFSDKEDAQKWLGDIGERIAAINEIIWARQKLYDNHIETFRSYPMRATRDAILQDKNNLIEAFNRFKPINADILAKGVSFIGKIRMSGDIYLDIYPGLKDSEITKVIEDLEKKYAKLIDTYPVN